MVHLRIIAPPQSTTQVVELLKANGSSCNLIVMPGAAEKPAGDVVLCDVAREEASILIGDLRELDIPEKGSISIENVDFQVSAVAEEASRAAVGSPSDAVIWEELETRTSESTELSASYLAFFMLACMVGAAGILTHSPILIVGSMVLGPEFGPLAGFCVGVVERQRKVVEQAIKALVVGFPLAVLAAMLFTYLVKWTGIAPADFSSNGSEMTRFISNPDGFSILVAVIAGIAGVISLTSAKSGALIGVVISVTTIPAASNIGVSIAYADWSDWRGAQLQLVINLTGIVLAGLATLFVQRKVYQRRRQRHLGDRAREQAGLPLGRSRLSGKR